jgi:hypothetical protein
MEADFLRRIGTSNRCAVGSSVHGVVVVGDLLRRHCLVTVRGKFQMGGESEECSGLYDSGGVMWIRGARCSERGYQ